MLNFADLLHRIILKYVKQPLPRKNQPPISIFALKKAISSTKIFEFENDPQKVVGKAIGGSQQYMAANARTDFQTG